MPSFADELAYTCLASLYHRNRKKLSAEEKQEYLRLSEERMARTNAAMKFDVSLRDQLRKAAASGMRSIEVDVSGFDQLLRTALTELLKGHGLYVRFEHRRPRARRDWKDVLIVSW